LLFFAWSSNPCAADKEYKSPFGKAFKSYAKAKAHWEQDGAAMQKQRRSRGTLGRPVVTEPVEEVIRPGSVEGLLKWLRGRAAMLAVTNSAAEERGFVNGAMRARETCLDVRITRRA
jgi:hypothetical protein